MRKMDCEPGCVWGEWTILNEEPRNPRHAIRRVRCRCSCGVEAVVYVNGLRSGDSRSCGHLHRDIVTKHGATIEKRSEERRVWRVWSSMRERCNHPTHHAYHRYGGRGIKVCSAWDDFIVFRDDMGSRPSGGVLDRIDNNQGYSPENCRWVNRKESGRNREDTIYVMYGGEKRNLSELCEERGINYGVVVGRVIRRGWEIERALSTPTRRCASGSERKTQRASTIEYRGETLTILELSHRTGMPYNVLYQRIMVGGKSASEAVAVGESRAKVKERNVA